MKRPSSHVSHDVIRSSSWYWPAGQTLQAGDPPLEMVPFLHS